MRTTREKTRVMILGSDHFNNPSINLINNRYDDVLAPKRQAEMEELVERLKPFRPTKIALTVDDQYNQETQEKYQGYLKGTYQLTRCEYNQIGFRLAKALELPRLYCVDYFPDYNPFLSDEDGFDSDLINYPKFAYTYNQEHLLPSGSDVAFNPQSLSIIDIHRHLNDPESIHSTHEMYLQVAKIGEGDQYPGANWVTHNWHARNLKIFVNLTRITESADDRILLIIPAGHIYIVQQFLQNSGDYSIEPVLKYFNAEQPS